MLSFSSTLSSCQNEMLKWSNPDLLENVLILAKNEKKPNLIYILLKKRSEDREDNFGKDFLYHVLDHLLAMNIH